MKAVSGFDTAGAAIALLLMAIATAVLWQATEFTAFASIFPRAVGGALLLCSALVLWRTWRQRARERAVPGTQGLLHSAALVLTIIVWVAMLETAGFLLASWAGFFVLALIADREPIGLKRCLYFMVAALVCVVLLQLLFQKGLDVRLPAGVWLPGILK